MKTYKIAITIEVPNRTHSRDIEAAIIDALEPWLELTAYTNTNGEEVEPDFDIRTSIQR